MWHLIRKPIIASANYPGFRHFYQTLYGWSAFLAARYLASDSGVRAVMLKQNLHFPLHAGLSDLDFIVLLNDTSLNSVTLLTAKFRRLKRGLPHLGELSLFTQATYADFVRFGPGPASTLRQHYVLFDRRPADQRAATRAAEQAEVAAVTSERIWYFLFRRYVQLVAPALLQPPHYIGRQRLRRLLAQLQHRLANLDAEAVPRRQSIFLDEMARLSDVLAGLQKAAPPVSVAEPSPRTPLPERLASFRRDFAAYGAELYIWKTGASVSTLSAVLVVDDIPPPDSLRVLVGLMMRLKNGMRSTLNADEETFPPVPLLLPRSAWRYFLSVFPGPGEEFRVPKIAEREYGMLLNKVTQWEMAPPIRRVSFLNSLSQIAGSYGGARRPRRASRLPSSLPEAYAGATEAIFRLGEEIRERSITP